MLACVLLPWHRSICCVHLAPARLPACLPAWYPVHSKGEGNVDPAALTRQHHVHAALQASLTLVPSGRSKLFGVLKQNYPHRRLRAEILSDYALHALRVVQYAPLIEVNNDTSGWDRTRRGAVSVRMLG